MGGGGLLIFYVANVANVANVTCYVCSFCLTFASFASFATLTFSIHLHISKKSSTFAPPSGYAGVPPSSPPLKPIKGSLKARYSRRGRLRTRTGYGAAWRPHLLEKAGGDACVPGQRPSKSPLRETCYKLSSINIQQSQPLKISLRRLVTKKTIWKY